MIGYHACLRRLIQDHHLRAALGRTAFLQAQDYSWAEAMEALVQGYRTVMRGIEMPGAA